MTRFEGEAPGKLIISPMGSSFRGRKASGEPQLVPRDPGSTCQSPPTMAEVPDASAGPAHQVSRSRGSRLRRAASGGAGIMAFLAWWGVGSVSAEDLLGEGRSESDAFELEALLSTISGGPNKYELMIERDLDQHVGPGTAALIRLSHRNRW